MFRLNLAKTLRQTPRRTGTSQSNQGDKEGNSVEEPARRLLKASYTLPQTTKSHPRNPRSERLSLEERKEDGEMT